jgi:protein involved in sex pheromone biosynthesis
MKGLIFILSLQILLMLSGCAVSEQSAEDVGEQFQEGIQGRGKIVPNETLSDDFGPDYR